MEQLVPKNSLWHGRQLGSQDSIEEMEQLVPKISLWHGRQLGSQDSSRRGCEWAKSREKLALGLYFTQSYIWLF